MTSHKRAKLKRDQKARARIKATGPQYFAIFNELLQINKELGLQVSLGLVKKLNQHFFKRSGLDSAFSEERTLELLGEIILDCFNALGPVYGKMAQIALSRSEGQLPTALNALHLDRLYSSWPPLPYKQVQEILDSELPHWRLHLDLKARPLGVASMAQVHEAVDKDGRSWVLKIIKPHSRKRLHETLAAITQMIDLVQPLVFAASGRRTLKELRSLVKVMGRESNLELERFNIERMRGRMAEKRHQILRLPETRQDLSSRNVLCLEKFDGPSLADIIEGKSKLDIKQKKRLARKILGEMLVQVFELGLFHGDPHGGNLILLPSGEVGLFDWGLTGELQESDRIHIAALLRSMMTWNRDRLVDALVDIARDGQVEVGRDKIDLEVAKIAIYVAEQKEAGKSVPFHELINRALEAANRLQIPIPDGLLMMAKSLLTIEGLARGIDPKVSMGLIASPILFRLARPDMIDILEFSKKLPQLAGQFLTRS